MATGLNAGNIFNTDRDLLDHVLRDLMPSSDYACGVIDLLCLLGLARRRQDGLAPSGEVAAMVIDSLRAHLAEGVSVGLPWNDLDAEGLRGVDVLRTIELARWAAVEQPAPARTVRVVQAVIKARQGDEDVYLMQFDRHAGRYQPIGGKQEPTDVDADAALRREIMEELGLNAIPGPDDCTLEFLCHRRMVEISATYGILTAYDMDFYAVGEVRFPIRADASTRWLTRREIAAQRASDSRAISSVYQDGPGWDRLDALPPGMEL